jgi:hypothetical protein
MPGVTQRVRINLVLNRYIFTDDDNNQDIPWIDNTHVSLTCEWEHDSCVFQFWKDSEEQFYCQLSECSQTSTVN